MNVENKFAECASRSKETPIRSRIDTNIRPQNSGVPLFQMMKLHVFTTRNTNQKTSAIRYRSECAVSAIQRIVSITATEPSPSASPIQIPRPPNPSGNASTIDAVRPMPQ